MGLCRAFSTATFSRAPVGCFKANAFGLFDSIGTRPKYAPTATRFADALSIKLTRLKRGIAWSREWHAIRLVFVWSAMSPRETMKGVRNSDSYTPRGTARQPLLAVAPFDSRDRKAASAGVGRAFPRACRDRDTQRCWHETGADQETHITRKRNSCSHKPVMAAVACDQWKGGTMRFVHIIGFCSPHLLALHLFLCNQPAAQQPSRRR